MVFKLKVVVVGATVLAGIGLVLLSWSNSINRDKATETELLSQVSDTINAGVEFSSALAEHRHNKAKAIPKTPLPIPKSTSATKLLPKSGVMSSLGKGGATRMPGMVYLKGALFAVEGARLISAIKDHNARKQEQICLDHWLLEKDSANQPTWAKNHTNSFALELLQGTWQYETSTKALLEFSVEGNKVCMIDRQHDSAHFFVFTVVDATQNPHHIDFLGLGDRLEISKGIFRIEQDTLLVRVADFASNQRPRDLPIESTWKLTRRVDDRPRLERE